MFPAYPIAAITVAAGVGSLALFGVFLWTGGLELVALNLSRQAALAWDAALCFGFFVQHSGMVRRPFRSWLGRTVPARWHGVLYTMASAVALLLLVIYWQPSQAGIGRVEGPARWLIRAIFVGALLGFGWAACALGDFDLFGTRALLAGIRTKMPQTVGLQVKGPYRHVRHPFYFCAIVAIWACPALSFDRMLFDILWTCWIAIGARLEERDLAAQFGDAYRAYQREVPMLVPWRRGPGHKSS